MQRILVVNRGALSRRLIRSVKEAGLQAVALATAGESPDAEPKAPEPHAGEADFVAWLDAAPSDEALRADRLVAAAMDAGCDGIHPGCGRLAVSRDFAGKVMAAGLGWIGASPDILELFDDRHRTRQVAHQASLPVVDGTGPLSDVEEARTWAERGSWPIVLKAVKSAGRGLVCRVDRAEDLPRRWSETLERARALDAEDALLAERWVERARHVEVQVVADRHGNMLAVGERDTSMRHRNAKWVEECPAPALDDTLRRSLARAAVLFCQRVKFTGVGTVEFLVTPDARFYFLCFTPRLQQSHAVSEAVYGVDLVDVQLRVANGDALYWHPQDIRPRNHALSFRILAVDVFRDGERSSGRVEGYRVPEGHRVESRIEEGRHVDGNDDPLLARIVITAPNRQAAIVRGRAALQQISLSGLPTNLPALRDVTADEDFWWGRVDAATLERRLRSES